MPHSIGSMDGRELQREVVAFTVSFEPYVSALVDDIVGSRQEELDESVGGADPSALASSRDAASVGVAIALSVIRVPHEFPAALPASSMRTLRLAVRRGQSLADMDRSYRRGHAVFQDHVFRHAERTGTSIEAVRRITDSLFAYYDWAIQTIATEFSREQATAPERGDPGVLRRIELVLAGSATDDLGYDLEQTHIALVIDAGDGAGLVEALADALGVARLAGVRADGLTWAWLGAGSLTVGAVAQELTGRIGTGHVGLSEPEAGRHGFVGAHRKAQIALRLGLMRDIRVSGYRDVALEALAFGGEDIAIDFARAELGRLAESSRRVAMLRETVQAYFAQGSSTVATARALGIAERTVTYRLRRAEELIGRPVAERRADLETALRLHDVLDV
jgi:hypothetical protein